MAFEGVSTEDLLARYSRDKDVAVRNEIVTRNAGLTHFIVFRYFPWFRGSTDEDDAISDGNEGLLRAVELFDPHRGFKFSTYASRSIYNSIMRGVKLRRNQSRGKPLFSHRGEGSVNDMIKDDRAVDPADNRRSDVESLREAMDAIGDERLAAVIHLRFFQKMTLDEVGAMIGVTKERVRQLEMKGIRKLRRILDPEWDGQEFRIKGRRRGRRACATASESD